MKNGDDDEILRDPIEDDPAIAPLIEKAGREAKAELDAAGLRIQFGYCHFLWSRQQEILREKYGIEWRCPATMNPDIHFD
jgi:hypothetical protein